LFFLSFLSTKFKAKLHKTEVKQKSKQTKKDCEKIREMDDGGHSV